MIKPASQLVEALIGYSIVIIGGLSYVVASFLLLEGLKSLFGVKKTIRNQQIYIGMLSWNKRAQMLRKGGINSHTPRTLVQGMMT